MGLRSKIIGLFFVGFSFLSAIGVYILQNNLKQSYSAIEHQEAIENMHQLANSIDDKLGLLNQLTNDWAFWDQMYNFVKHPNEEFSNNEIGVTALRVIGMNFSVILNNDNEVVFFETADGQSEISPFNDIIEHVKWRDKAPYQIERRNCGIDQTRYGVYFLCWQRILHADMTGDKIGTLILGELLDEKMRTSILKKASPNFQFIPTIPGKTGVPYGSTPLFDPASIQFDPTSNNLLHAKLFNIVGQPVFDVHYQFSKSISQRGDDISFKVVTVLLVVAFLNGLVLLTGVHTIVIRRVDKMVAEVNNIKEGGKWAGNLIVSKKRDELYKLGNAINQMLTFIRQQMANLESIANTDSLTRIGNRLAFDQRLSVDLSIAKRNLTGRMSLLLIDVDFFKQYNDFYGHPAGDQVLKTIARLLKNIASRPSDLSARIGGEEFAIILPTSHIDGAVFVANKLIAKLAELRIPHEKSLISEYVTISIGVTIAVNTDDETSILKRVDEAMYKAKLTGRNKLFVIEPNGETNV